jgi:hypothetical protein
MAAAQPSKASKADTPVDVFHPFPIKYIPVNGSTMCGGSWHTDEELQNLAKHTAANTSASTVGRRASAKNVTPATASMVGRRASAKNVTPATAAAWPAEEPGGEWDPSVASVLYLYWY